MELKNLNNLKDEIAYLEEAEELLRAILNTFDVYELENKMSKNLCIKKDTVWKLRKHFNFDDSE